MTKQQIALKIIKAGFALILMGIGIGLLAISYTMFSSMWH